MYSAQQRFSDVLFCLYTADRYNQSIGRIQLQKFIYLADTISVLWKALSPKIGHESFKHGPFDFKIQNAVDVLAFRGFVEIIEFRIHSETNVETRYKITEIGKRVVAELKDNTLFMSKLLLFLEIGKQVDKRGWHNLKSLVYSEPSYVAVKSTQWKHKFNYMSLRENETLRILFDFEKLLVSGLKLNKENFTSIFFKLIEA